MPSALGADDGIGFPVADALAGLDDGGACGDRAFPGEPPAAVVGAIPFATLLPAAAQGQVQGAAAALVRTDVSIDRLMADAELVVAPEAARDLFGTPQLAELSVDLGPVRGGEALIAARVRSPGPGVGVCELGTIAAIVPGGIAADLAANRAAVAAEQSGN